MRSTAAALLFGVLLSTAMYSIAAAAAPPAPADGTYAYTIVRGGAKVGDSTITVKSDPGGTALHEVETFVGVTDTVDATFDAATLTPTTYTSSFPLTPEVGVTVHLQFSPEGARQTVEGTSGATDFRLEEGTSHLVVIDGAMMTGFLMLPAQVKAMPLVAFTVLAPSRADTYSCRINASAAVPHPVAVPASDVSLWVDGTSRGGTVQFVEWYDPRTMLVDEVDVPLLSVTIMRKIHS